MRVGLFARTFAGTDPQTVPAAIRLPADRIAMAHAEDRTAAGGLAAAGTGVLDYPFHLRALRDAGFDRDLVIHGLSEAEAPAVAKYLGNVIAGRPA